MFTAMLTGTITVNNVSGSTKLIASIQSASPNYKGIFGSASSGVAMTQTADVALTDPYESGAADASPIQKVLTTNQFRGSGMGAGTSCTLTASSTRWINCPAIASGNRVFTNGTAASATGAEIYSSTDADWTNEQAGYLGVGAVTFMLDACGRSC